MVIEAVGGKKLEKDDTISRENALEMEMAMKRVVHLQSKSGVSGDANDDFVYIKVSSTAGQIGNHLSFHDTVYTKTYN